MISRPARRYALALSTGVILAAASAARALDLEYIKIADTSTAIPGAGGTFSSFSGVTINGNAVAFYGNKAGYTGIFTGSGGTLTGVVDTTTIAPNAVTPFTSFTGFSLDTNQVAFTGVTSGSQGIYLTTNTGTISKVADQTTAIPNGTGNFSSFSAPSLSQGNLAFVGNGASQQGVYSTYNGLHTVADTNTTIPSGTGNFALGSFSNAIQMYADTTYVGSGSGGQTGIYDNYYFGSNSVLVNQSNAVPGGVGNFTNFGLVSRSNYGWVGWIPGSLPGSGVYTNNNGPISVVADTHTAIPNGNGSFSSFSSVSASNGDVAFIGNGSGGQTGLYTNTGGTLISLLAKGSVFNGKTVSAVTAADGGAINNGNLAFDVAFTDGSSAIYVAEQNYNWAANTSGAWDNAANWSFGLKPRNLLYAEIHPDSGSIVTGPTASTTIQGLGIGANNGGLAELRLQPGTQVTVTNYTYVDRLGQITLNGGVYSSGMNLDGIVNLSGGQLAGGNIYITNNGTLMGSGTVGNQVENHGFIQSLNAVTHFASVYSGNDFNNFAEYQIINSQVQIDGDVENNADQGDGNALGRFDVRNSILQFTQGLHNHGQLNFSFGISDVFGPVTIGDTSDLNDGQVTVSGNSSVTFYDRLIHNGDFFRVTTGSTAVFFGLVSGAGTFTGAGSKVFEGGYSPGNSPAAVSLDGPVTFDTTNSLIIQIGGPNPGTGYDHVQVNGQLFIDGALQVSLINGYTPAIGSSFDVLDWTSATGTFASVPSVVHQGILTMNWTTTQNPSNVVLTLNNAFYDLQSGSISQSITGIYPVIKSTAATATLTSPSNYTSPTTLSAGKLIFSGGVSHSIASVTGPGSLQVDAGTSLTSDGVTLASSGVLTINGTQTLRSSGSGGAYTTFALGHSTAALSGTSKVSSLVFGTAGILDLRNNALIVEAAAGTKASLIQLIASDIGAHITSSTAATSPLYGVVIADNADLGATTFGGLPVDSNSIIVTQALLGDANLDGVVNPTDLLIWAHNFNNAGSYSVASGDFNHDGVVNPTDLLIWAHAFNNSIGASAPSDVGGSGIGLGTAPVPEPASLALLGLGAAGLMARRRRNA